MLLLYRWNFNLLLVTLLIDVLYKGWIEHESKLRNYVKSYQVKKYSEYGLKMQYELKYREITF